MFSLGLIFEEVIICKKMDQKIRNKGTLEMPQLNPKIAPEEPLECSVGTLKFPPENLKNTATCNTEDYLGAL